MARKEIWTRVAADVENGQVAHLVDGTGDLADFVVAQIQCAEIWKQQLRFVGGVILCVVLRPFIQPQTRPR